MREGDPGEVLVSLAERHGADVLVVGSQGMQRRILGSVPNTVAQGALLRPARQDDVVA
jgi:nucleotide-binding universal stress UspA family protein